MNIILVSGKHPLEVKSGYARYAACLARQLVAVGADVHIFCVGNKSSVSKTAIGTIHTVYVPLIYLFAGREMVWLLPASLALCRAILPRMKTAASVIWGIGPWSLAGAWVKRKYPSVLFFADYFVSIRHEYQILPFTGKSILAKIALIPLYARLEKYLLTQSTAILTHYQSSEEIFKKEFHVSAHKFRRIPYMIDVVRSRAIPAMAKTVPMFLTVCRQDYRKGISYLLRAYAILNRKYQRYRAVIVGEGDQLENNRRLARRLHLANVTFIGHVELINAFLNSAYCFVLPSLEEGGGSIAVLEAMAACLPIVASNVDGIPEDVEDGKSGLLVPPGNSRTLANTLETLLKHPHLARRLGRAARIQFLEKYNKNNVRAALSSFLHSQLI